MGEANFYSVATTFHNKLVTKAPDGEIEEVEDTIEERFKSFKNFEVITNPPDDHHFIVSRPAFICFGVNDFEDERIKEEWEILETSLPNSIFVRAYETRMDLLRVAIVGLDGTPYSHGLFFFDVLLPNNYPAKPPLLFHRSYGLSLDINSSLQGKNRVLSCLKGMENPWNPSKSNILQMLGVIQQWMLNVKLYNKKCDEIFMLSHKAMVSTLQSPPTGFEDFVKGYFRKYSHVILMQWKVKFGNSRVEFANKCFFELLRKAFEANGSYCNHFGSGMETQGI
ncbi:hypothetical protein Ancab_020359 [Ancistrocladus abbreviatus]